MLYVTPYEKYAKILKTKSVNTKSGARTNNIVHNVFTVNIPSIVFADLSAASTQDSADLLTDSAILPVEFFKDSSALSKSAVCRFSMSK